MLEAKNINKSFKEGNTTHHVLQGLDLKVAPGEFLAIMGSSGSGKSTLLHILGLLDKPDSGEILFDGVDTSKMQGRRQDKIRNKETGFVFQFYHLLPELNALENIMLPVMIGCPVWKWLGIKGQTISKARELLEMVGLSDKASQKVTTLSGGERQRVSLARALVKFTKAIAG